MSQVKNFEFKAIFEIEVEYWKGDDVVIGKAKVTTGSNIEESPTHPFESQMKRAARNAGFKNVISTSINTSVDPYIYS